MKSALTEAHVDSIVEKLLQSHWDVKLPVDPEAIAEKVGIAVVDDENLTVVDAYGLSEVKEIRVRTALSSAMRRYVVAQELGRIVCHFHNAYVDSASLEEISEVHPDEDQLVRHFARMLLMPQVVLEKFGFDTKEKRKAYDVPEEAMYVRLLDAKCFLAVESGVVDSLVDLGVYRR